MPSWEEIKEVFFTIGSIAGVIALARPIFDKKLEKDLERVGYVTSLLGEQELIDLDYCVWNSRRVPDTTLSKFARLWHESETNQDCIRFSGPTAGYLKAEFDAICSSSKRLHNYVQVPEWEPSPRDEDGVSYWVFNKQAFIKPDGEMGAYEKHLDEASAIAKDILIHFQRFQIVSELHLYEVPVAKWLLKRRFQIVEK